MTWRMYAWIGLLRRTKPISKTGPIRRMRRAKKKKRAQALAVVAWLRRDVERDPSIRTVERDRAHFLQIAWARACTHGERRGRVGIIELVAEVETEFLNDKKRRGQPKTFTLHRAPHFFT